MAGAPSRRPTTQSQPKGSVGRLADQPGRILNEVAAFKAFVTDIESRCDEPPVVTELTLVGSYSVAS